MKLDELIASLIEIRGKVGNGDIEIPIVCIDCENDVYHANFVVSGVFDDCNGSEYNCAIICNGSGDEFSREGVPHYEWKPEEDKVVVDKESYRFVNDCANA